MLVEFLKGVGYGLIVMVVLFLWLSPNPFAKLWEIWRFFRGD